MCAGCAPAGWEETGRLLTYLVICARPGWYILYIGRRTGIGSRDHSHVCSCLGVFDAISNLPDSFKKL